MDYCKKCKNFGCNAAGTERTTTDCEEYMSHLPTNADRIRAMTDEELADFLCNIASLEDCTSKCPGWGFCRTGHTGLLDWLKQEAES